MNRHNYESFFLLYIDNELSGTERNVVEEFIRNNPDLTKELAALQQSKLPPTEFIFKDKASLLKSEEVSQVMLDKLLLYIDDELNVTEVMELEMLLAADHSMTAELKLLQQTKSLPDTNIGFPGKSSLYRKEAAGVIPFGWWKVAVAAVFIGCCIWAGSIIYIGQKKTAPDPIAINKGNKPVFSERKNINIIVPEKKLIPEKRIVLQPQNIVLQQQVPGKNGIRKITVAPALIKEQVTGLQSKNNLATGQQIVTKPTNNLPKPYFNNDNKNTIKENPLTSISPQMQYSNTTETNKDGSGEQTALKNNVYTASLTENTEENKEDKFTFSDDEPKKSKLTGFLRKAKRVLERNTRIKNSDDNVKVANLEFAIH